MESGARSFSPPGIITVCADIPHTRPYHCKNWSYFAANLAFALWYILDRFPAVDIAIGLQHDATLGSTLDGVARELLGRPEVIAAPNWYGSPDTHCLIMKREAMQDILYSCPFTPLPKVTGRNVYYIEHAIGKLFAGRWWNPWPTCPTIRQEYGTPELYRGTDAEVLAWPLLAKASPDMAARYKAAHPIERFMR